MSEQQEPQEQRPRWGFTRHGLPVHARVMDHHKGGFNKKVALWLTAGVGNMRTFWAFCVLALLSLPATFVLMQVFSAKNLPGWVQFFLTFGWIYLITWICQNFIQLVLLPALMTGQQLQNEAADARADKTFEDVEQVRTDLTTALDRLDLDTKGGIADVMAAVQGAAADAKAAKASAEFAFAACQALAAVAVKPGAAGSAGTAGAAKGQGGA